MLSCHSATDMLAADIAAGLKHTVDMSVAMQHDVHTKAAADVLDALDGYELVL
jgi:hypothetical protein